MKIKNYQIEALHSMLFYIKVSATNSRLRTRFNKLVSIHYQTNYVDEMNQMIQHYAVENEDGDKIVPEEYREQLANEMNDLGNEFMIIEANEINKKMLISIYSILTSEELQISETEAIMHDEICTELERVIEENYKE